MPLGGSRGPGSASGGLVAAKFVKCPKSYYTEQFEKYGKIRDKYDTTYNTPTPYDPSLVLYVFFCKPVNVVEGVSLRTCCSDGGACNVGVGGG